MKNYILGIDQGSTGSKVLVVDVKGEVVCSAYRGIDSFCPHDGWVEHDPDAVWQSVREAILEAAEQFDMCQIRAIGITNQRETTILWERATGKALTPAVSWQCVRSQAIVDSWAQWSDEITETTGLPNHTYYSASKIAWLLEQNPGLRERCEKGEICFGTINTWVLWNLTGGKSHLTDSSNAGRTMFFDVRKDQWSESLIEKFNIPKAILPGVLPCDGNFGMAVEPAEAFQEPIPIMASIGDQMSALFGQACFERGEAKCSIGTCLNLVTYTGEYAAPQCGIYPAVASNDSGNLTFEIEGGVNVAGSINEWLVHQLGVADSPKEVSKLASQVESTDGAYFVPAFGGLFAPHWNNGARGLIIGLSRFHDKRHICRAAVESIALQTNDIIELLRESFGVDIKVLRVDGGVAKSDFIMQLMANILNCRIERPKNTDRTPMGAVYLAGLSSKLWKDRDELKKLWVLDRAFEPDMDPAKRQALIDGWQEAVKRSFDWIK